MTHDEEVKHGTSASSAEADSRCPGRFLAQRGLPDLPSEDAAFGTGVHETLATGDESDANAKQLNIAESCKDIEAKLVAQVFGPDASKCRVFVEERFWCNVDGKFLHSAKPDKAYRFGPKALILEYKALAGQRPDAPSNKQVMDQCVLVARSLLCTEVYAALVQPLITHDPTIVKYDYKALTQAEQEMRARVVASNNLNAKRVAGPEQCKFCKAKPSCKEYAVWNKSLLPAPVNVFDVPVSQWTPEQCATFCNGMGQAEKWLSECKAAMRSLLEANPDAIPGWQLEPGQVRHPIVNPQELFNRFLTMGRECNPDEVGDGIDPRLMAMFMQCVTITKEKFEAQVRAATKLKGKALNKAMQDLLKGVTEDKQNAPSLAIKDK